MIKTCIKCSKKAKEELFMKGRNICKNCKSQYDKEYRKKRGEKYLQMKRDYYHNNKEKVTKRNNEWKAKNKDKMTKYFREYASHKRKTDIEYKIKLNLRRRLNNALKRNQKKGSAINDLGCDIKFFKKYLKSKFKAGMNWSNYGTVWEIDHIKPLCKFNLTNERELKNAVHYTNLQPLFCKENKQKGGKYRHPVKPYSKGII